MRKYMHVERLDHENTEGILNGLVYVFPKIDGTNTRLWPKSNKLIVGSRNRIISNGENHFRFQEWAHKNHDLIYECVSNIPSNPDDLILYGEWLVHHTLNTYRDDAWNQFYLFDVYDINAKQYLHYDFYKMAFMDQDVIKVIDPLKVVNNPSQDQLIKILEDNTYLIKDGCGVGEGIVIKNYDWKNQNGKQVWAKIVRNEFKEQNRKVFNYKVLEDNATEKKIIEMAVTQTLVDKEKAKLQMEPRHKKISRLLDTVFYCLINEELWRCLKKLKNPVIDFRYLRRLCEQKTKELSPEIF